MNNQKILSESFEKIKNYLKNNNKIEELIVNFKFPAELNKIIDFPINQIGVSENEFLELLDKYLNFSVRTGNKQFLNQLYSGFNFPAFIGEIFSTLANTSMYTYEVAPVATMIETEMIKLMNSYAGYSHGDGIFVSGGSNANLIAMLSARNKVFPEGRFDGYDRNLKLKIFVNEQAHYSFETAANILGIGAKNVIKVKADENGRLIPSELEREIKDSVNRGEKPFFAVATCATTLLGAYDPIDEMADICEKYGVWLHADGSFGGSIILSKEHRYLVKGIEKTDSFAWNPHKLMNIPLICSVILVKRHGSLQHNITDINADYIFHDIDMIEDLGKKSIQCGRKVDAVKLWFAWKYFGLEGYKNRIDNLIEMAKYAEKKVIENTKLELIVPRQSFSVCFRYIPEINTDSNEFNLKLRESLRKSGKSIVNFGYIGDSLTIRLIAANAELNKSDIDLFFNNLIDEAELIISGT
ncbi:MAG: glutamate decarboxylase [Bacteroidetes bacterium]|jgi:glutamate/tyrosine decarboxylase-like PLP-dependent enzyme|nr:glutamate decarboxylase [Bacteroidota bacterium]MBT6687560.1 glutamate decarboxylase [Bacteroidota bacterium]MBT7142791.1 glutamate decarboxylase [Bacteroidota bacterium]MBT7491994.1 glutamate decarboxylase [Bacteroidota bacterium]